MLLNIAAVSYLRKSDSPKAFRCVLLVMSGTLFGDHFSHDIQKVVAISVMVLAAISDPAIHGIWLLVNQFREYLHESTLCLGDNINVNTNRLIRYLKLMLQERHISSS